MKVLFSIRNFIFLLLAVFVGYQALNFSLYRLLVNFTGSSLYEVPIDSLSPETLDSRRYLKVSGAVALADPLIYFNDYGDPVAYVYALSPLTYINAQQNSGYATNLLIESSQEIDDFTSQELVGLLTPYWSDIDPVLVQEFGFAGITVKPNCYYLEMESYPLRWYWNVLILGLAFLFFYRMIEAIIKTIKNDKKDLTEDLAID